MIFETYQPDETLALGMRIGRQAKSGQIYTLTGDLGVGKTVFTQGMAKDWASQNPSAVQPLRSFRSMMQGGCRCIILTYTGSAILKKWKRLVTMITFFGEGVCLIEWAELIEELLPEGCIRVTILKEPEKGFDYRRIIIEGMEEKL